MKKLLLIIAALLPLKNLNAQWTTNGPSGGNWNGDITGLAVSGSNIFAATGGAGVFISTDNGGSWTAVNNGLSDTGVDVLAICVSGSTIFVGTAGGAYRSTDSGASWTPINTGFQYGANEVVYSMAVSGSHVFCGTDGDSIYVTTNNGDSWSRASNGLGMPYPWALAANGANVYAVSQFGGVYYSPDYGSNWTSIADSALNSNSVNGIAVSGSDIYVSTFIYGMFLSTNNGATWTAINAGLPAGYWNTYTLLVDTEQSACPPTVFVSTGGGRLLASNNNGTTWLFIDTGIPINPNYIPALAVAGTTLFAGTFEDGVYQRTIPTLTTGDSLAPPQVSASQNTFCAGDSIQLCATAGYQTYSWNTGATGICLEAKQGGSFSVTVTDDNGCTAVSAPVSLSLYPVPVVPTIRQNNDTLQSSVAFNYQWYLNGDILNGDTSQNLAPTQNGYYSVVISDSNGCFATSAQFPYTITAINYFSGNNLPVHFKIYPNPTGNTFLVETNSTPEHSGQQLQLFDLTGQLLLSQRIQNSKIAIDVSAFAAGVYLLSLQSGEGVITQKLVITR